ncbi:bifunctional 2-polyprenyl-6-hydroxyphenol methylase/3-demethylubiquinol 3-O-methyltransferase UbiG [uncultured Methylovirgula sp.]|uniref:bifunctional 2-polyprenyl-6-hydroxyphenol methylase/3-demethylubiquinol 3-O-methyltransferase UbiG n=1 Tax=uncultured Methylovirgula sp. TaxID=1285960 RepID=UPI002601F979|nr:bifunctional 2-polyprenyl-6-hydroxyphenol methylase/3-demethylubiquinol 3-O-methyltransferase UbiG [uncultured Methylovirgula sp.]
MSGVVAPQAQTSVDPDEVARFDRLAATWWDLKGPMKPLHRFNPVRVNYLKQLLIDRPRGDSRPTAKPDRPLDGLEILDIGCGGGILSEALARLGGEVTGIDPAPTNIAVARRHGEESGLRISYLETTAEALAAENRRYDVVLAMEVVEHVRDVKAFVATAASMVRPGGVLVAATLNRTLKSYAMAIVGAEYILRWLPRGTHDWDHFVTPRELRLALRAGGLKILDETGVVYHPLSATWRLSRDMDVNYIIAAERKA